jgi:formylglycine-generating enzyme required for sulfatase activity
VQAPSSEAAEAWDRTKDTTSIALLETFIARYKDTYYADLARARIEDIKKREAAIANPPAPLPARLAARCDGTEAQVGDKTRCLKPKDTFRDCPEMVVVPAGRFSMGTPESEPEREGWSQKRTESPEHEVTIGAAFAVGRFAVMRGEYANFVRETNHSAIGDRLGERCWIYDEGGYRPGGSFSNPGFAQDDRHPAVCVSWKAPTLLPRGSPGRRARCTACCLKRSAST